MGIILVVSSCIAGENNGRRHWTQEVTSMCRGVALRIVARTQMTLLRHFYWSSCASLLTMIKRSWRKKSSFLSSTSWRWSCCGCVKENNLAASSTAKTDPWNFMKGCEQCVSSISYWAQLMLCTSVVDWSTLIYSGIAVMPDAVRWRDVSKNSLVLDNWGIITSSIKVSV